MSRLFALSIAVRGEAHVRFFPFPLNQKILRFYLVDPCLRPAAELSSRNDN
jgi:hypothetical protein